MESWKTVSEEDHPVLKKAVSECLTTPGTIATCYLRKPSSKIKNISHLTYWEFSAYIDEEGELSGILCIGQEITFLEKQLGLLQQLPESYMIINAERKILEYDFKPNHPFSNLGALTEMEDFLEIYPCEAKPIISELFDKTALEGTAQSFEYSVKTEDGLIKHYQSRLSIISYQSMSQVFILERDITSEKQNNRILKEEVQRTRNIWESMTDLYHFINNDWEIEYANSAWEEFFGMKGEDYVGKNVWELFPNAKGSSFYEAYMKSVDKQEVVRIEDYYEPNDQWYNINIYPSDEGISIYTRDITENKKLQLKERALKEKLVEVWDKLIDGYITLDNDLRITYSNPAWNKLFNCKAEDVEGKGFTTVFPEMVGQELINAIKEAEKKSELVRQVSYFSTQELWISSAILKDNDGFNIYMHDVTSQERMRNAMSDLSFMTSHELRHEYAKLHSVINLLSVSSEDEMYLMKEANKSLIQINSLISVMNDKLTFNRDNSVKAGKSEFTEFEEVILIDDDHVINFINARVIRLLFVDAKVKSFVHANKALNYLEENDKMGNKLIFIDLNMPSFDGWDFLEEYKNLPVRSPVYILTSSINPKDIERSMQYDEVLKFLTKPLSADLLEGEKIRPIG
ncbi:MAG: PAS domain-containing protein [Bacteroidia bacterium]